jgi:hypothetical protein
MPDAELPQWLDKTGVRTIGVLTLDDGKEMTAEVVEFDEERRELVVEVISPNHPHPNGGRGRHAIPVDRIVSFEPKSRAAQPWPYSDLCHQGTSFSLPRFVLMSTMFLCLILGSLPLFFLLMKRPYGLQEASAIVYTIFEVFFTFAATRSWRPYMFTCQAVQPQIPRLLWRHLGFLVALFALQTAALAAHPNLPEWWNVEDRKGSTPFELALLFLCVGLGFAQVFTNRSLLDRAHREFSA